VLLNFCFLLTQKQFAEDSTTGVLSQVSFAAQQLHKQVFQVALTYFRLDPVLKS